MEGGGSFTPRPPTSWFSLNNSKMVKAVTLESCSIEQNSIRDIRVKFDTHNSSQFADIGQNSDRGISNFRISGQFLIKGNCNNSRTSGDIDMKLGPVTKLDKRNETTSKHFDDNVMSGNCDVIAFFRN